MTWSSPGLFACHTGNQVKGSWTYSDYYTLCLAKEPPATLEVHNSSEYRFCHAKLIKKNLGIVHVTVCSIISHVLFFQVWSQQADPDIFAFSETKKNNYSIIQVIGLLREKEAFPFLGKVVYPALLLPLYLNQMLWILSWKCLRENNTGRKVELFR